MCLKKWAATGFYIIMTFCQNVIYFAPPSRQEPEYERIYRHMYCKPISSGGHRSLKMGLVYVYNETTDLKGNAVLVLKRNCKSGGENVLLLYFTIYVFRLG